LKKDSRKWELVNVREFDHKKEKKKKKVREALATAFLVSDQQAVNHQFESIKILTSA